MPRDIVVTKTGVYFGKSAVIPDDFPIANTSAHVGKIKVDENIVNSYYLSTFLNSKYGYSQLRRRGIKATRPEIKLIEFNDILIAKPKEDNKYFQDKIEEVVKQAELVRDSAKKIYSQAEDLLLSELGLKDWEPTEETVAVKRFSESFLSSGRLDAEHYKPKYDQALQNIQSLKPKKIVHLEDLLVEITNGKTPLRHNLTVGNVKFLTAEHIHDFKINYKTHKRVLESHHKSKLKRTALRQHDILVTIKGRVGNAAIVEDINEEVNINQDVALLRLKKNISPYYLVGFLNSQLGKLLVEQTSTGQINPFLSLGALRKLSIPIFEENLMFELGESIQSKVYEFTQAEHKSKQLLEIAKHGVEKAIETDEETATNWINQELEKQGISLSE